MLLGQAIITAWDKDFDASFWVGTGALAMSELGFASALNRLERTIVAA